jgi:hypothetical protein
MCWCQHHEGAEGAGDCSAEVPANRDAWDGKRDEEVQ